ncbi:MAG: arginine decarboxylase [Phycisphaeraceae bacterium]|nr:arginine decarboxylase [Phycisphaeraceae bacterium]
MTLGHPPITAPSDVAAVPAAGGASWSTSDAAQLYAVDRWGQGYFAIGDHGHLTVRPEGDPARAIDLKRLVDDLRARDLHPPLLIRFADILQHRVNHIHRAFETAIRDNEFRGRYQCVYPIKVNQQRHVVEEILNVGRSFDMGVEAGSKPELLAVMATVRDDDTLIICNGFKDDAFIEAVILAAKIGKRVIPVVEKFSELRLIAHYAKLHDVKPAIGIRAKLLTQGRGRWEQSSGLRSKFGLFTSEMIEALQFLRDHDMADCLRLLHFHLGSQAQDITTVKSAIGELARLYVELTRMGAALEYIDVGGGLGVDYAGSKSNFESSVNYSLEEYASNVVFHVREVCDQAGVAHPTIISESGRALVAYHSVLIVNVSDWSGFDRFEVPETLPDPDLAPQPLRNLFDTHRELDADNYSEFYFDARLAWDQILDLFKLGYCTIEQRGLAERLYFTICSRVFAMVRDLDPIPEDFAHLERMLADTYFCNWSVFQSLPDSWAIDQLFPVMPIHRLGERPTCRGTLADITCDSDGRVDRFIGPHEVRPVLDLHPCTGGDYYLGIFLVGAYQEILGDMHNLLGDTTAIHVSLADDGAPHIDEVVKGDTVREVLHYVQYSADELLRSMRRKIERSLREKRLTLEESRRLLQFYESGLNGYTYLSHPS